MTRSAHHAVVPYLALMAVSAVASFAKWFAFARILGAEGFAYYALLELVGAYGLYLGGLGLVEGTSRVVPMMRGARRARAARALAARATGALLVTSTTAAILFILLVSVTIDDARLADTLRAAAVFALVNNLFLMGTALILGFDRPQAFAVVMVLKNVGALLFGSLLGSAFGVVGVITVEVTIAGVLAFWCLALSRTGARPRFGKLRTIRVIFASGFPLMVNALLQNASRNIDRFFVGGALGLAAFGQYSFAMTLALAGMVALNILTQYVTPRLCYAQGAGSDLKQLVRRMDILVGALATAAIATLPLFVWAVERYGSSVFPDFALGLSLMPLVYVGATLQVAQLYQGFLIARGEGWRLTRQTAIVGILSIVGCVVGILNGASAHYFAALFVSHRLLAAILLRAAASRPVIRPL